MTVVDTTPPTPDIAILPSVTGRCSVTVTVTPTATDTCSGVIGGSTSDSLTYDTQGTYTIIWTYDDGHGNIATQTQNVIVQDTGVPVPDVANLPDVTGECSVTVSTVPTATDGCSGTMINGTTSDPLTYTIQGTYTIIWTYEDGHGNTSTQTQTVIVDDTTAPVCNAKNIIIQLDESGTASITGDEIDDGSTDNCGIATLVASPDTFDSNNLGQNTVTLTITDFNGNSSNCDIIVTVENSTVGVHEVDIDVYAIVYPNPFSDEIFIKLPESFVINKPVTIYVYDIRGRLVKNIEKVDKSDEIINLNDFDKLQAGSYYIRIENNLNKAIYKKVIKI